MTISKILKSEEEFEQLLEMFQHPCLIKVEEIENTDFNFNIDDIEDSEDMRDHLSNLNKEDVEIQVSTYYTFLFITQQEIKELLEI